eukprot:TRINITY_DN15551_c0_g1_i1.p2 TRINITY_DN15551_c0_g1~~TRINITY_DN15551_c0_g1_i1.p2  ORF type:complete len:145 (-),score=5.57 TRINITY_DN15551_c0_g1_i1:9-443(-)
MSHDPRYPNQPSPRLLGAVVTLKRDKGFGFLKWADSSDNFFFHFTEVLDGAELKVNDQVEFELEENRRNGKLNAVRVLLVPRVPEPLPPVQCVICQLYFSVQEIGDHVPRCHRRHNPQIPCEFCGRLFHPDHVWDHQHACRPRQ